MPVEFAADDTTTADVAIRCLLYTDIDTNRVGQSAHAQRQVSIESRAPLNIFSTVVKGTTGYRTPARTVLSPNIRVLHIDPREIGQSPAVDDSASID